MAQEYAAGAVHNFVWGNYSPIAAPAYLGTAEQGPSRQTDRTFKRVMNDLSSQKPFDYVYAGGEEAVLSFVLTRWNEPVARALEAAPVSGGVGFSTIFDQGTLMGQEEYALELWYVFTFVGLGARATMPGMEGGRHYLQAIFWGPEQDEIGSHERKKHMVFKAWKKYNPDLSPPRFTLFDFSIAGLPAID